MTCNRLETPNLIVFATDDLYIKPCFGSSDVNSMFGVSNAGLSIVKQKCRGKKECGTVENEKASYVAMR